MLKNLTIKIRLAFVIGLLCLISISIGALGLRNLQITNDALKTMYNDQLVVVGQLSEVLTLIQENQNTLSKAVSGRPEQLPAVIADVEQRIALITGKWDKFMAGTLTAQERALAGTFADSRKKFVAGGLKPILAALRVNDMAAAVALVHGELGQTYLPVRENMRALVKLQLDTGMTDYRAAVERYEAEKLVAIGLSALALLAGTVIGAWLIGSIGRALAEALRVANSVAAGDLTERIRIGSHDEIGQLLMALQTMNDGLVEIVTEVRGGTELIATASGQIAAGNLDLSSRTEEQASSLEETASSMSELTLTVRQNADHARQANALAEAASQVASRGGEVIGQMVGTMSEINNSSRKIGDIIGVIDEIAFQTNILALNAAVEAARAGAQGRGFAVVASEVRHLAQRSAAAAKQIKTLIGDSVSRVDAGSKLVDDAGSTMRDIVDSVRRVTDIMADISAASHQQSVGIEQINQAIGEMDQVTQQNAALVEQASAASQALQEQAARLAQVVSVFKVDAPRNGAPARPAGMAAPRRAPAEAARHSTAARALNATPAAGDQWEVF